MEVQENLVVNARFGTIGTTLLGFRVQDDRISGMLYGMSQKLKDLMGLVLFGITVISFFEKNWAWVQQNLNPWSLVMWGSILLLLIWAADRINTQIKAVRAWGMGISAALARLESGLVSGPVGAQNFWTHLQAFQRDNAQVFEWVKKQMPRDR
jgi:hypothetical protein